VLCSCLPSLCVLCAMLSVSLDSPIYILCLWFSLAFIKCKHAVTCLRQQTQYDNNNLVVVFMARKTNRIKEHFTHEPSCFILFSLIRNCAVSIFSLFMDFIIQWFSIVYRLGWSALDTTLCDNVCQWIAAGRWFSQEYLFPPSEKLTVTICLKYCWKWR